MSCPARKSIVNSKRNELEQSYASKTIKTTSERMASNSQPIKTQPCDVSPASLIDINEVVAKSTMCLLVAILKEKQNEGCFNVVLNSLLRENGMANFNMGTVSAPIIIPSTFDPSIYNSVSSSNSNASFPRQKPELST